MVGSLSTVMSLARSAGSRLRPQLPKLVPALLEALSGLESSSARYISTATAQRADTQQTVDRLRLSAAKDSTMFRTLSQVRRTSFLCAGTNSPSVENMACLACVYSPPESGPCALV